MNRNFIS